MEREQTCFEGNTGIPGLALFGRNTLNRAYSPLITHTHDGLMEIVFLHRGVQQFQVGGRDYTIKGGEAFISQPSEPHSTGGSPQETAEYHWIQLDLRQKKVLGLAPPTAAPLLDKLRRLKQRVRPVSAETAGLIRTSFSHMCRAGEDERAQAGLLLAAALYAWLAEDSAGAALSPEIERAASYATARIGEPLSLDELADKAGLSLSRFKARFREETGVTPRSYINRLKIQQAQVYLRQGASITDVSQRLGFSTPNYFATVFRRFTAMSPMEYARLHMEAGAETPPLSPAESAGL